MNKEEAAQHLKEITRSIPDYPKPGIIFRDLTTIFQDGKAFSLALDLLKGSLVDEKSNPISFDKLAGIEARGFILAGGLAAKMGGGEGRMSMEALRVIIDDLLATGGTAEAGCKLIEEAGGNIVKALFLVELPELEGRKKLEKYNVESIISFDGH